MGASPKSLFRNIGPRALSFLRRVAHEGGGSLRVTKNSEREAAEACFGAGYLAADRRDDALYHITTKGAAFLNRLARVE